MEIVDPRTVLDFQKFTFSGHLRSHVYKVLDENIRLGHADYACYWSLELMCSGLVHSMWQTFFESTARNINRSAPNAFLYLIRMYEKFAPFEAKYPILQMTDIRNNDEVRVLICETIAGITMCRKNKLPPLPKIKPDHDFDQKTVQENLKSPSSSYVSDILKKEDPFEVYIALNELVYCLRPETRDFSRSIYWIAWILKHSKEYKRRTKLDLDYASRSNPYVDDKYSKSVIWILWDIVHNAATKSNQSFTLTPYIDALYKMHCLRWAPGLLKQRIVFLTTACMFICESTSLDIQYPCPPDSRKVTELVENIPQWIGAILRTKQTFS